MRELDARRTGWSTRRVGSTLPSGCSRALRSSQVRPRSPRRLASGSSLTAGARRTGPTRQPLLQYWSTPTPMASRSRPRSQTRSVPKRPHRDRAATVAASYLQGAEIKRAPNELPTPPIQRTSSRLFGSKRSALRMWPRSQGHRRSLRSKSSACCFTSLANPRCRAIGGGGRLMRPPPMWCSTASASLPSFRAQRPGARLAKLSPADFGKNWGPDRAQIFTAARIAPCHPEQCIPDLGRPCSSPPVLC